MSGHATAGRATYGERNPLPDSQFDHAIAAGLGLRVKLPPPTMPDGLDVARQRAVIASIIRDDYCYEDFTRKSAVAPQRLRIREVIPADQRAPAHGLDVRFVAYDDRPVRGLAVGIKGVGTGKALTKEHLAKRGIKIADGTTELYRHVEFGLLEKFYLRATVRMWCTKTEESLLMVAEVDPRFQGDLEFPNQLQPLVREGDARRLGAANHWDGASFYMKITKMAEPAGAMFVEQHIIFVEPVDWFNGANLLRSKLPHVVQNVVRNTRREWAQSGGKWYTGLSRRDLP
jgi:hypothetical protein